MKPDDRTLIEAAKRAARLSTSSLAALIDLDRRRLARCLETGEPLPGSARLLVQLIAARPAATVLDLQRSLSGIPLEDPARDTDEDPIGALRILLEHLDMFPDAVAMIGPGNVDIARRALARSHKGG